MILKTKIDIHLNTFKQSFKVMKQKVQQLKEQEELARAGQRDPLLKEFMDFFPKESSKDLRGILPPPDDKEALSRSSRPSFNQAGPQKSSQQTNKTSKNPKKYLVRERIDRLKDPGTLFLEFSSLAGRGLYKERLPSSGLVTGVAMVKGRPVVVVANDWRVKGGAYFPITIKKHLRAQEVALENRLPCIYLMDSGGAYLPYQDEVFPDKEHFGRIFYNQAHLTALGVPQIAVAFGLCTAGGAYVPAMSDENIIVKGQGAVFLGGPPLVKSATGEKVSAEELGGAVLHTASSGVMDHLAEDEDQAIAKTRQVVAHLGTVSKREVLQREVKEPLYPAEEMYGIIPQDLKTAFDIREIIARLVDGSEFHEFKEHYGPSLVTGWARLCGQDIGIVANNGVLFGESALKGAHFINLCDQRGVPLVFLQNIVGFMVGQKYEKAGIAKQGAQMVTALSLSRVPKFTVIVGSSYGAGNYGMCGRAYQPRQLWMWPSGRIAVMGGPQAENVLKSIKSDKALRLSQQYERQSTAYYSTSRLWDDGLIDPVDTRPALALGLDMSLYAPLGDKLKGVYRF